MAWDALPRTMRVRLVLLAVLLAPTALAAWAANGQLEPSTSFDEPSLMWADPEQDTDPSVRRLYFHGYDTMTAAPVNPNLAALGSQHRAFPLLRYEAVLGVWKDCNGDGYVGLLEHGVLSYPSEALLSTSICPPYESAHNDGALVTELVAVGMVDPCRHETDEVRAQDCPDLPPPPARSDVILVREAAVWADSGYPGAEGKGGCPVTPLPPGTTSGTGMLLRAIDCAAEGLVTSFVQELDHDGSLGLRFEDPENPQTSGSLLNQHFPVNLFGNPVTGRHGLLERDAPPVVGAWDCAHGSPEVRVASDVTNASAWSALVHAAEAADDCDPSTGPLAGVDLALLVEGGVDRLQQSVRARNDLVFRFDDTRAVRAVALDSFGHDHASMRTSWSTQERGLPVTWVADTAQLATPPLVSRNHFPEPNGRFYWTFYARVDPQEMAALGISLPGGGASRAYAAEACETTGPGAPDQGGWACDPARWWLDVGGGDVRPRYARGEPLGAVPGDAYLLRDVDCDDGRVAAGLPLYASLAPLSVDGTCP